MKKIHTSPFASFLFCARKILLMCFIMLVTCVNSIPLYAQFLSSGSSGFSSLAATADGKIYSWGGNWNGQLGNGNTFDSSSPLDISSKGSLSGKKIIQVATGDSHSLALASDGTVHAWGSGEFGQLGNGTSISTTVPTKVPNLTGIISIAVGLYHSLALKNDGSVYAWGWGIYGQLGNGTSASSATPLRVMNLTGVTAIAASAYNSFALKSNGTVYAWGEGVYGQLGNNSFSSTQVPVQVHNLVGVTAIVSGEVHSLALKNDGTVFSWGRGDQGQLGNGDYSSISSPAQVANLSSITAIAGGAYHSLALRSDGTVYAWGQDIYGQLGNGIFSKQGMAVPLHVSNLAGVRAIASGAYHSLVLKSDGTIYAWGRGIEGQLGDGNHYTSIPWGSASPVKVINLNLNSSCSDPIPKFSANEVCLGSATNFVDESTNVDTNFDNQSDIDGDGVMDIDALYDWDVDGDGRMDYYAAGNIQHTYTTAGVYTAKLTIKQGACQAEFSHEVIVKDLPTATLSGDAAICQGNSTNMEVVLTGTAPWSITYTDGTTPATITAEASPLNITVSPTQNATYTLEMMSDASCTSNSLNGSATIGVTTPPELTVPTISSVASERGTCSATVAFAASATGVPVPDIAYQIGEGTISSITSPYLFPVGSTTVTAIATNSCGTATSSFDITVTNDPPVITSIDVSLDPQPVSASIPVSVSFHDNNAITATLDWGDGSVSEGNLGTANFTGGHNYTTPGVYTLEAKLKDACQAEVSGTYQYVVIYDPYGGFVTGGGWFQSPEGAYVSNPQASGKASFGFVSKYQKGSSVPVGNTDFQFMAADLKFKSTSYDWLVVAGYKAMYKGLGELNGASGYGFLISAVDSEKNSSAAPDKFRIKIWESSGSVVYDNQTGGADDAEAATSIGGGSIVIHEVKSKTSATARTSASVDEASALQIEETATAAYPNPFVNRITVEFHSPVRERINIYLLDVTGKTLYNKSYEFSDTGLYEVEVAWPVTKQIYLLKIDHGRRVEYVKVVGK